jgi:hypothetical protein
VRLATTEIKPVVGRADRLKKSSGNIPLFIDSVKGYSVILNPVCSSERYVVAF